MWRLSIFLLWRIKLATVYISLAKSFIGPFSREQSIKRAKGKEQINRKTEYQSSRAQSRRERE
jgi:hypothetical protein